MRDRKLGKVLVNFQTYGKDYDSWGQRKVENFGLVTDNIQEVYSWVGPRVMLGFHKFDILKEGDEQWMAEAESLRKIMNIAYNYNTSLASAWRYRENERFEQGEYKRVSAKLQYKSGIDFNPDHYIHIPASKYKDQSMIAFTKTEADGLRDKQTVMKLGKYLKMFYPRMTDKQIEKAVRLYRATRLPKVYDLKITKDRKMIADVFETKMVAVDSGNVSCMFDVFKSWKNKPYHAYAENDTISVAYMVVQGTEEIVARSVLNEVKKTWVRTYAVPQGDDTTQALHTKLTELLEAADYSAGSGLWGCSLTRVPHDTEKSLFVVPYLDGNYKGLDSKMKICDNEGEDCMWDCETTQGTPNKTGRVEEAEEPRSVYDDIDYGAQSYYDGLCHCASCERARDPEVQIAMERQAARERQGV